MPFSMFSYLTVISVTTEISDKEGGLASESLTGAELAGKYRAELVCKTKRRKTLPPLAQPGGQASLRPAIR